MKRKRFVAVPFIAMPIFLPIYMILDGKIFVEVFGCGCSQNAFNANDLREVVFWVLTILLTILGIYLSKALKDVVAKIIYCVAVLAFNVLLSSWVINTFVWK